MNPEPQIHDSQLSMEIDWTSDADSSIPHDDMNDLDSQLQAIPQNNDDLSAILGLDTCNSDSRAFRTRVPKLSLLQRKHTHVSLAPPSRQQALHPLLLMPMIPTLIPSTPLQDWRSRKHRKQFPREAMINQNRRLAQCKS